MVVNATSVPTGTGAPVVSKTFAVMLVDEPLKGIELLSDVRVIYPTDTPMATEIDCVLLPTVAFILATPCVFEAIRGVVTLPPVPTVYSAMD